MTDYNPQHDLYPLMEKVKHTRFYSLVSYVKRAAAKIKRMSDRLDDWCDQSIGHLAVAVGAMLISVAVGVGVLARIFLL